MKLQTHVQLFGPVQYDGALKYAAPATWGWSGSAATASIKTFEFGLGLFPVSWVRWIVVWTPGASLATKLRLVHFSDFEPGVNTEIAVINGAGVISPIVSGAVITDAFNALVSAKVHAQIGWQSISDATEPFVMYESRLEILYDMTGLTQNNLMQAGMAQ